MKKSLLERFNKESSEPNAPPVKSMNVNNDVTSRTQEEESSPPLMEEEEEEESLPSPMEEEEESSPLPMEEEEEEERLPVIATTMNNDVTTSNDDVTSRTPLKIKFWVSPPMEEDKERPPVKFNTTVKDHDVTSRKLKLSPMYEDLEDRVKLDQQQQQSNIDLRHHNQLGDQDHQNPEQSPLSPTHLGQSWLPPGTSKRSSGPPTPSTRGRGNGNGRVLRREQKNDHEASPSNMAMNEINDSDDKNFWGWGKDRKSWWTLFGHLF